MTNEPEHPTDGLVSRVHLIDEQPLEERAAAYSQLVDELRATLEGSDSLKTSA
ncbi:hypothetical protein [Plantibacter sp. CFBP 8775]|uniref:hypothetical protein n=1 Tax=Plantibacter sp. CFBP 8775 TaxID=2774038 RepID=UPI00177ECDBA|nr:hypothetical protein [Plantibacter sp. CFBP 8775]MBD8103241.1 hypothetical protein [Plantibacter sp. CFBP 8775]